MHRNDFRFSRREVRAATGWGDTQLKIHLARLVELEYLLVHRAERGQGYVYELLYDGDSSERLHLSGLIDAAALQSRDYDGKRSGVNETWPAPGRDVVGGQSVDGRSTPSAGNPHGIGIEGHAPMLHSQTTLLKPNGFDGSYAPLSLAAVGGTQ